MLERTALALFDAEAGMREGCPAAAKALAGEAAAGFRRVRTPLLAAAFEVAGDTAGALALFLQCGATYDVRRLEHARRFDRSSARDAVDVQRELSAREREIAISLRRRSRSISRPPFKSSAFRLAHNWSNSR